MIPYGKQSISDEDIEAVLQVLKSDFLTQGEEVPKFEKDLCEYVGVDYGVAVNSGTSALHIACLSLGLSKDDYLWTSPVSFVASSNCALYCGAKVDFIDIELNTGNIDISALRKKLKTAKKENSLPKIIIPVHLSGLPCDMAEIYELSEKYGFKIIEDASHAIGGKYEDSMIGNCKYSDITIFSFHPVKNMTTAEGGMAVTNKKSYFEKMEILRTHGITRNPSMMTHSPDGPWYYQQIELGFNYRLSDVHAALGRNQLKRLDKSIQCRHRIAKYYDKQLANLPYILPARQKNKFSGMHLYIIKVDKAKTGKTRDEIFSFMRNAGIGVNIHYIPIHTQPYYQALGFSLGDFPNAELFYDQIISIPIYPDLTKVQQDYVVETLMKAAL